MLENERLFRDFLLRKVGERARENGRKMTFVQIGANDGKTDDPLWHIAKRENWSGIVVEPDPRAFELLVENYANRLEVQCQNVAIGSTQGSLELFMGENSRLSSLDREFVRKKTGDQNISSVHVEVITLDHLLASCKVDCPELLVVDAEGLDDEVIQSLDLKCCTPKLIQFESHNIPTERKTALINHLENFGYRVVEMIADSFAISSELSIDSIDIAALFCSVAEVDKKKGKRLRQLLKEAEVKKNPQALAEIAKATWPKAAIGERLEHKAVESTEHKVLKKWFFASNERGIVQCFDDILVGVRSCTQNTSLEPNMLYFGRELPQLEKLRKEGVVVHSVRPPFEAILKRAYGDRFKIFSGHWLRLQIPAVSGDEGRVLYTDTDVMFLKDPAEFDFDVAYVGVVEEVKINKFDHFNSGVMYLNLDNLRPVWPWFCREVQARLEGDFAYPPHDQGSLNDFFLPVVNWLDRRLNWKPYWGFDADAVIVHFHGPKPGDEPTLLGHGEKTIKESHRKLFNSDPQAFRRYAEMYNEFLFRDPPN